MLRLLLLRKLALVVGVLAIGNLLATLLHWYGILWWLDMPAHFFGGVSVLYLCAIFLLSQLKRGMTQENLIFWSASGAMGIGIAWEILQYGLFIYSGAKEPIFLDVLSDIGFDFAGVLYGSFVLSRHFLKDTHQ